MSAVSKKIWLSKDLISFLRPLAIYLITLKELHHSHSDERSLSLTQRSYINFNSLKIFIVPKKASPLHIIGTTL